MNNSVPSSGTSNLFSESIPMTLQTNIFPPSPKPFKDLFDNQDFAQEYLYDYQARFLTEKHKGPNRGSYFPIHPFTSSIFIPTTKSFFESFFWFLWCMAVLYHFSIELCLDHLLEFLANLINRESLLWTFLE